MTQPYWGEDDWMWHAFVAAELTEMEATQARFGKPGEAVDWNASEVVCAAEVLGEEVA